jgi:hypothetical protein
MSDGEVNWDAIIDIRFVEIEIELDVLNEYRRGLEHQLPSIIRAETARLEVELAEIEDYERVSYEAWIAQFTERDLPRFFRSPILVALWAIFESSIRKIAGHLQKEGSHSLKPDDIRGTNDFDKYEKYYAHILEFPLVKAKEMRSNLQGLLLVRNAIAHTNGEVAMIKDSNLKKINEWSKTVQGISIQAGYLHFTADFVEKMISVVTAVLTDLVSRVREKT